MPAPRSRRFDTLSDPLRLARIARVLWIAWAIAAWNVVFDHVIVVAGREYIATATRVAHGAGPFARMDEWMRPAVTRAFWSATIGSFVILGVGLALVRIATPRTHVRRASRT